LIARVERISSVRERPSQRTLATPTPCSALIVPPAGGGEPQHRVLGSLVVGPWTEHIHVTVSIAQAAEQNRVRLRHDVKRWREGDMRRRWTAAGMLVAEQQFRRIIGYRDLARLVIAIERHALRTAPTNLDRQEVAEPVTV
jgi:hypothetical protein